MGQKKDIDSKAIQQKEFVEQLKTTNGVNTDSAESMFILMIFSKLI